MRSQHFVIPLSACRTCHSGFSDIGSCFNYRTASGNVAVPETNFWGPRLAVVYTQYHMRELLRFFWNSTRGHRFAPWRSPYLRWRMETYSGLKMDKIGFVEFWGFMLRERKQLRHFLKWTSEMDNYARPKPKNP